MTAADDARLQQLAEEPRRPVFRVLDRAGAMGPLVLVLAVLPGLQALVSWTIDDDDALWGMDAVALARTENLTEVVDRVANPREGSLRWHPPLSTWLTAVTMRIVGVSRPLGVVLVSYVSTAGLVIMAFVLVRELLGPRTAIWTALLAAFHQPVLLQIQTPAPRALSVLLAAIAVWGWYRHRNVHTRFVSWALLAGGVSLGLCLLSAGSVAAVAVATILLDAAWSAFPARRPTEGTSPRRIRRHPAWRATAGLGIFLLTGATVGGWWVLMLASGHGSEFWHGWLAAEGFAGESQWPETPEAAVGGRAVRQLPLWGALTGVWAFGCYRALVSLWGPGRTVPIAALRLLLVWQAAGLAYCAFAAAFRPMNPLASAPCLFFTIPILALAAYGVNEMTDRRGSDFLVATMIALCFWSLEYPSLRSGMNRLSGWRTSWLPLVLLALLMGAAAFLGRSARQWPERNRRIVLQGLILLLLVAHAKTGLATFRADPQRGAALTALREQLALHQSAEACWLLTDESPPPRLMFILHSLWSRARIAEFATWTEGLAAAQEQVEAGKSFVVIDWRSQDRRPTDLRSFQMEVEHILVMESFDRRPLRAYVLRRVS